MTKHVLSMIITMIGLFGIIYQGERLSVDTYASNDLNQSPVTILEDIRKGQQTGESSKVRAEGGSENDKEHLSDKKVRITFLGLSVFKTHMEDQYSPLWKLSVGVKDNSSAPLEQKEVVLSTMNLVPVREFQVFKLYPYDEWYYPFPPNSNVTYFDVYVPEYEVKKINTGLLIYAYGSVSTNSDVRGLEDNKLGNISAFYTSDEAYGLGQHHTTSSLGDYMLVYRVDEISKPNTTSLQALVP